MNVLLDTHTFLWTLFDTNKLSNKVLLTIENEENKVFISAITFWEISLKYALGKLQLNNCTPDYLPKLVAQMGFDILPFNIQEASSIHQLPLIHRDPFDRMLIWQSINYNLTFISKDKEMKNYKSSGLKLMW